MTPDGLRRQAEERLGESPGESGDGDRDLAIEAHRLVHELKVHQIELELQNEELKRARDDVEEALARYTDLYELAPVGYLTLGQDGVIQQTNLTGARLLGTRAFPAGGASASRCWWHPSPVPPSTGSSRRRSSAGPRQPARSS